MVAIQLIFVDIESGCGKAASLAGKRIVTEPDRSSSYREVIPRLPYAGITRSGQGVSVRSSVRVYAPTPAHLLIPKASSSDQQKVGRDNLIDQTLVRGLGVLRRNGALCQSKRVEPSRAGWIQTPWSGAERK